MRDTVSIRSHTWLACVAAVGISACGTQPPRPLEQNPPPAAESGRPPAKSTASPARKQPQVALKKGGGFYKDDGPADEIPDNLDDIPDAEPKWEPLHRPATKPYVVLGKEYVPNAAIRPYKATGIASWYGKKFHGQKTSIGEPYDMFAMTAAHTTLAIPSYVRVSNPQNGKSVIVRVTDRGPFHADRIIDLSYTAAWKLGLVANGSGMVQVEAILPEAYGAATYAQAAASAVPQRDDIESLVSRLAMEEAPPPASVVSPTSEPAAAGRGIYLQLGAFTNADNAENLKNHLTRELDWLTEPMRINVSAGVHRLQLGPYASRVDAGRIAEKIRLALGYKPAVVTR